MNARSNCLTTAEQLVNHDRNTQYDEPSADFKRTAAMWSAYLGVPIELHDVAAMMVMLKVARIRHAPQHFDSWVDVAGYAACGWDVTPKDDTEDWLVPADGVSPAEPGALIMANMDPTS